MLHLKPQTRHPEAPLTVKESIRPLHVRVISLNVLQLLWFILSDINSYSPNEIKKSYDKT